MIRKLADRFDFDLDYYLSGASLLMVDQGLTMFTSLATTWCFTNFVPKEVYGAYNYILAIAGLLLIIGLPGVSQAIQRSAARGFDGALIVGMRQRMAAGVVAGMAMLIAAVVLYALGQPLQASGALVAAVLFPLVYSADDYRSVLFGKQRFGLYLGLHTSLQTFVAASTIVAILLGLPFFAILAANMGARSLGNLAAYYFVRRRVLINRNVDEDFNRFGWNLSLVGVVGGISYWLDSFIVGSVLGLEVMAAYGLSVRLTDPLRTLGVFLNKLLFPRVVRVSGSPVARRFLFRAGPLTLGLILLGFVATAVVGPLMLWIFPKYPEAIPITRWMIWSSIAAVMLIYLETYYISQERFLRTYYVASTLRPVAIIILLPPLIYQWGVYGAVAAKLLVRLAEVVALLVKLVFDWRKMAREEIDRVDNEPSFAGEQTRCPLCGDKQSRRWWRSPDRRYGLPGNFTIVRCNSCGLLRQQPRMPLASIGRYYPPEYVTDSMLSIPADPAERCKKYRRQWLDWIADGRPGPAGIGWRRYLATWPMRLQARKKTVRANPLAFDGEGRRLLDIGCGNGEFIAAMTKLGWHVSGSEPSPMLARQAQKRGLAVVVGGFPDSAAQLQGSFDAVTMRMAIEHMPDPIASLQAARELLTPDGVLLVETVWADSWIARLAGACWYRLDQPRHQVLFTRDQLATAMRAAGLRVAMIVDHSSAESSLRSLEYWLAHRGWRGSFVAKGNHRMFYRLAERIGCLLDLLRGSDAGYILAVRDDRPTAGWAPRELRENLVR